MSRTAIALSILLLLGATSLGGCGQSGPLYLPNDTPPEDIQPDDDESDDSSG